MGFLEDWDLSYDEINEALTDNPSLRSFVMGYAAEMKCRDMYFANDRRITDYGKWDDHDRLKKGDIYVEYRGQLFNIEVKSLQTNSLKTYDQLSRVMKMKYPSSTRIVANFQCDASDRRTVTFKDGSTVDTTCLLVGEFDLLAVNLHGFYGEWDFAFAKNDDLPRVNGLRGKAKSYSMYQRQNLLATSMPMTDPIDESIYSRDPFQLMDELIEERAKGEDPTSISGVLDIEEEEDGHHHGHNRIDPDEPPRLFNGLGSGR